MPQLSFSLQGDASQRPANRRSSRFVAFMGCLAVLGPLAAVGTVAQEFRPPAARPGPGFGSQLESAARQPVGRLSTSVEFTILMPRFGAGVEAQRWAKALSDLGVSAQMRAAVGGDEVDIDESVRGTLRTVRVVGQLTQNGRLAFPGREYSFDDVRKLAEWIRELQTYGAQGTPAGQPRWGLSEAQFTEIYESLSTVVEVELEGRTLEAALAALPLPKSHPLRRGVAADAWLVEHPAQKIENRVQGLSCGSVLAIVLAEAGLGFHPERTPDGRMELLIEPIRPGLQMWPVGWKLEGTAAGDAAPNLHKFVQIGFEDAAIQDVLDAAGAAIEVPILVDYFAARKNGVDLEKQTVSYPEKRTSWSLMLNSVIRKANLIKEVRADELGRPFVYIAPFTPTPVEKTR